MGWIVLLNFIIKFHDCLHANQRQLLEYRENLEYFYVDSYGHHLNFEQACVLMRDVFESFKESRIATLYFSHSGAMLKILAYLNVENPKVPPRHDNFELAHNWTTSNFDTFAANIAFVRLSCDKVGMFINEKLTVIPGCENVWCDFEEFANLFDASEKLCDFQKICGAPQLEDYASSEDDRF